MTPPDGGGVIRLTAEPASVVGRWVAGRLGEPEGYVVALLFGGERLACCDEAVVARVAGQVVGVCTIAPQGEAGHGPALVGLYVVPSERRQGIGGRLLVAAMQRCHERGLVPVSIDLLSSAAARLVKRLPGRLQPHLVAHVHPPALDFLISQKGNTTMHLLNAFSLNMLALEVRQTIAVVPIAVEDVQDFQATEGLSSAVGHPDTAALFTNVLGFDVPANRATVSLRPGDRAIVGQYRGPRLEAGATTLPADATITWWLVHVREG